MYRVKEKYKNQKVVCFFADGTSIKLDEATQKDFEKVYQTKDYREFIELNKKSK